MEFEQYHFRIALHGCVSRQVQMLLNLVVIEPLRPCRPIHIGGTTVPYRYLQILDLSQLGIQRGFAQEFRLFARRSVRILRFLECSLSQAKDLIEICPLPGRAPVLRTMFSLRSWLSKSSTRSLKYSPAAALSRCSMPDKSPSRATSSRAVSSAATDSRRFRKLDERPGSLETHVLNALHSLTKAAIGVTKRKRLAVSLSLSNACRAVSISVGLFGLLLRFVSRSFSSSLKRAAPCSMKFCRSRSYAPEPARGGLVAASF